MMKCRKDTVIAIVALLVCTAALFRLCSGALISPHEEMTRIKTEVILAELETVLSIYQIDHGDYPIHTGDSKQGGAFLATFFANTEKIYLSPKRLEEITNVIQGKGTLVDAWGNPIHYRAFSSGASESERDTHNPTFDLWSKGESPENSEQWITNW